MMEGKHLQEHKLYRHQTPYIDNEIFVGIDSIVAYVTAQNPNAECYPASDSEESKILATDLENFLHSHSEQHELARKLEGMVWNAMQKYVGYLKLRWDPFYGAKGDIVPEVVDPNHVIVDHTAKTGENPRFICQVLRDTIEGLIAKFPDKEQDILRLFAIKRKGKLNTSAEIAYREVWFTYWDKDHKPQEAVAWYVRDLVLMKKKNPNWLYEGEGENFLENPLKPFIPLNLVVDGSNWIDKTSPLEQAVAQQDILNKLGRQLVDNLSTANGFKVLDSYAMSKDDAQNFTGDPNQLLLVKTKPNQSVRDVVQQLPPQVVSEQVAAQLQAARQTIHGILGTPSQFRGDDEENTKTATQALMIKNQASGRQDKIVRAVDYAMDRYFKLLTQMITVWYNDKHYATVNGGDGNFDFIEMHKNKIEKGMMVRVKSGTTLPFDKARQEAVAQGAAELGLLAPYDYYKLMHMDNPQKLYDNLVKWKTQPEQLAMDVTNNESDRQAIVDFTELMGGYDPEPRRDPSPEYIEQLRKLMISDEFLEAKPKLQQKVIDFVKKAILSLSIRTELDQATAPAETQVPLPPQIQATIPPQPPQAGMGGQPPGQPPMGQPAAPPVSPIAQIMQQAPQGQPNPMPTQPQPPQAGQIGGIPPM